MPKLKCFRFSGIPVSAFFRIPEPGGRTSEIGNRNSEAAARGAKRREGHFYSDGIYWLLCLFWLDLEKGLHFFPWPALKS